MGTELRHGPAIKSTGCSSRVPRFDSQHPHGGSELPVTPVPGELTPSLGSTGVCVVHVCSQAKSSIYTKQLKLFLNKYVRGTNILTTTRRLLDHQRP